MEIDVWWPLITLKEIIFKMPSFAYKYIAAKSGSKKCASKMPKKLTRKYVDSTIQFTYKI
jgi:hypothetical protein